MVKQSDIDKLVQKLQNEKENKITKYLDSLPNWLPKRYLNESERILDRFAFWLSYEEIIHCVENPFETTPVSKALFNMANISHDHYVDMMYSLQEIKRASTMGEEQGTIFLDGEDRSKTFLSKLGSKGAQAKDAYRNQVIEYAIALCNQHLIQDNSLALDNIAAMISPEMIKFSARHGGKILSSQTRASRTIKEWLENADKLGKLMR